MNKALRVTLADDHPLFLGGLDSLLRHESGFDVLATDLDGVAAVDSIRRHKPDIAVLDIRMPGLNGLQVVEVVRQEKLTTKIVLLTAALMELPIVPTPVSGIWAILLKTAASDTLVRCVTEVAAGKCWTIDDFPTGRAVGSSRLTPREREIASLVAVGMSNKQIARTVNISDGTVKIHLYNAYHKLEVTNRTALATLLHHKVSDEEVAS